MLTKIRRKNKLLRVIAKERYRASRKFHDLLWSDGVLRTILPPTPIEESEEGEKFVAFQVTETIGMTIWNPVYEV